MELWIGAIDLGLIYGIMAIGIYITFRLQNLPDMTVDGSFTTGAAVSSSLIILNFNPFLSIFIGSLAAGLTGLITGLIHTKLKIDSLLSGIIVMIALYSVNLHIMEKSNIPLLDSLTIFSILDNLNPGIFSEFWYLIFLVIFSGTILLILSIFFKTDFGIINRIAGENSVMASASGANVDMIKIFSFILANFFVGMSGSVVAQYQGFADIGMGIGIIVIGLASVIIGESLFRTRSIFIKIISILIGSVIFRFLISIALYFGMNPIDLKLLTALFVLITLGFSKIFSNRELKNQILSALNNRLKSLKIYIYAIIIIIIICTGMFYIFSSDSSKNKLTVGIVQISDSEMLELTKIGFIRKMDSLGYNEGINIKYDINNAHNDISTLNSIIAKLITQKVDLILTISSKATQTAIKNTSAIPIIFATVANPFIIGAGKDDYDHLSNVTGVYGGVPQDSFLHIIKDNFPDINRIGVLWDPGQPNAVFNVEELKDVLKKERNYKFIGTTVNGSSDVYSAAFSIAQKNIDAFVLPPDNVIYSAFESVLKAANSKKIPVFINDVERITDGALCCFGYNYTISGIQAALLADRVIKGENPKNIPFERYQKLTLGFSYKAAQKLNIKIPDKLPEYFDLIVDTNGNILKGELNKSLNNKVKKKAAIFLYNNNLLITSVLNGLLDEFAKKDIKNKFNLEIDELNAQNEMTIAQSIAQNIIKKEYDYLITISTPALQVTSKINSKIPQIFGGVTDPYGLGVAKNINDHQKNVTGVATFQPVENTFILLKKIFPNIKKVGIIWNPVEACSQACTKKARNASQLNGIKLIEKNIASTGEVIEAARALKNESVDVLFISGDNTVNLAIPALSSFCNENIIPLITNTFSDVEKGAFVTLGADYYDVGVRLASITEKVLSGQSPADIPIDNYIPEKMYLNLELAKKFNIKISTDVIKAADKIRGKL